MVFMKPMRYQERSIDFFHCFITYGSSHLYKKWMIDPAKNTHVSSFENIFKLAGFDGCIGSSDATNISMMKCAN